MTNLDLWIIFTFFVATIAPVWINMVKQVRYDRARDKQRRRRRQK